MHDQVDLTDVKPLKLTDSQQDEVVKFIKDHYEKGKRARKPYEDDWKACNDAYECIPNDILDSELDWQNNEKLPLAYDAVESWYAHLHQTMMPRDDRIFNLVGVTREDDPGAEVMEKYLDHVVDKIDLHTTFGKILKQIGKKNHTPVKVYWKRCYKTRHQAIQTDNKTAYIEDTVLTFNGPQVDCIDLDNFVMYPIYGDLEDTTVIHETYRYYSDLVTAKEQMGAPYFNLDKISADDENEHTVNGNDLYNMDSANDAPEKSKQFGLNIKECCIHRITIDDKTYKNYIATVVNDKWLIRFEPNMHQDGRYPFYFLALKPHTPQSLYGYGLLSKSLPLLGMINRLFNAKADEIEIKQHQPQVFYDDGVFNPYNVISRPGAYIEVSQDGFERGNLRPLYDRMDHLNIMYSEIAELTAQFESVTVPKVVKGQIEAGTRTATEISNVQNNSSGKMHIEAHTINRLLKWIIQQIYLLIYERVQDGDQDLINDIARITQKSTTVVQNPETGEDEHIPRSIEEMVADLPDILPLPEVDIKVVGYQNWIRKQETLMAMSQVMPQLIATPAAKYFNWYNTAEQVLTMADVPKKAILVDAEKAKEIDDQEAAAAEQQQAVMAQQAEAQAAGEQMKQQLDAMKMQLEDEINRLKLELDAREIELKYQAQLDAELLNDIGGDEGVYSEPTQ